MTSSDIMAQAPGRAWTTSHQGEPPSVEVGEDSALTSAEQLVKAMDGSERALLLRHLAKVQPTVVETGAAWLGQWRAECAERHRRARRQAEHDRRRRRRNQS